jgi:spore coat polysaccharide biosynthesis protein SpsF (cytidylyltransferase family)
MFIAPAFDCAAQIEGQPPHLGGNAQSSQPDEWQIEQRKAMEKAANLQRQQDIKKDTEKLLELATELKQAVDKSNQDTLSLDVIKKAEQIEKLAKEVKDKMKGP